MANYLVLQKQYQEILGIKDDCEVDGYSGFVLRHMACTRMAEKGIDVKTLQYIMGHSNISVTMDIYNHVDRRRVIDEIRRLGEK